MAITGRDRISAIINVNFGDGPPIITEVFDLPSTKISTIRGNMKQSQYRFDCMGGIAHPLSIEYHDYVLTTVHKQSIDIIYRSNYSNGPYRAFNDYETDFIHSVISRPEVSWAIDNSFDGIYIQRHNDESTTKTIFRFAVYMKEDQALFWRLKFGGTY